MKHIINGVNYSSCYHGIHVHNYITLYYSFLSTGNHAHGSLSWPGAGSVKNIKNNQSESICYMYLNVQILPDRLTCQSAFTVIYSVCTNVALYKFKLYSINPSPDRGF